MTNLTLELPSELYERIREEAEKAGKSPQAVAEEWLAERLSSPPKSEKERATEALRADGLLTELSPEEKKRAARSTATLEGVSAALDKAGGKPLSEVILEMRGPKE